MDINSLRQGHISQQSAKHVRTVSLISYFGLLAVVSASSALTVHAQNRATMYEAKMISSGRNHPTIDVNQDDLIPLCVALHQRVPLGEIRKEHGWSQGDLTSRIDRLKRAGLLSPSPSGILLPSFMVIGIEDARRYLPVSADLVNRTSSLISGKLPEIVNRMKGIQGFRQGTNSVAMFLVFSDVLLDNWQINNVEHSVLGGDRPLRDGNRYYFAIFEKVVGEKNEAFGIYGNGGAVRAGIQVNVYGNARYSGHTLISASDADLAKWFPGLPSHEIEKELLARLIQLGTTGQLAAANESEKDGLKQLGLINHDDLSLLIFSQRSLDSLADIASTVASDLQALLREHLPLLRAAYARSPYVDEITFDEYFIWWYHFFYTHVTNDLAARHLLQVPANGNVTYIVAN